MKAIFGLILLVPLQFAQAQQSVFANFEQEVQAASQRQQEEESKKPVHEADLNNIRAAIRKYERLGGAIGTLRGLSAERGKGSTANLDVFNVKTETDLCQVTLLTDFAVSKINEAQMAEQIERDEIEQSRIMSEALREQQLQDQKNKAKEKCEAQQRKARENAQKGFGGLGMGMFEVDCDEVAASRVNSGAPYPEQMQKFRVDAKFPPPEDVVSCWHRPKETQAAPRIQTIDFPVSEVKSEVPAPPAIRRAAQPARPATSR